MNTQQPQWHATTIIAVRRYGIVAIAGDGQVTLGASILKNTARKIRRMSNGSVIAGFAGATADAFTLFERLETKLDLYPRQLNRACVELARDWRTDKYLRRLEAMMITADSENTFLLSGQGDVLEPDDNIVTIGSGGNMALSAARALYQNTELTAQEIVQKSLQIAASICVYTNTNITLEYLENNETGNITE